MLNGPDGRGPVGADGYNRAGGPYFLASISECFQSAYGKSDDAQKEKFGVYCGLGADCGGHVRIHNHQCEHRLARSLEPEP